LTHQRTSAAAPIIPSARTNAAGIPTSRQSP
jgi:hypothetical protein